MVVAVGRKMDEARSWSTKASSRGVVPPEAPGAGAAVGVGEVPEGRAVVGNAGAPDGVGGAPDESVDSTRATVARKMAWVWTGRFCTMETAPIITLLISIHAPQRDCRFCLEEMAGEWLVLWL
jgi:hypothetical protein